MIEFYSGIHNIICLKIELSFLLKSYRIIMNIDKKTRNSEVRRQFE